MRYSREHWLEVALEALGNEGPDALTVDRLCALAGRTRGSLYHHFTSHNVLIEAVACFWRDRDTLAVMSDVGGPGTESAEALRTLNALAQRLDFDVEVNIRRLAARYSSVAHVVAEVDRARIRFLEAHYQALRERLPLMPGRVAEIEYAMFIGLQHLAPGMQGKERRELFEDFARLLERGQGSVEA